MPLEAIVGQDAAEVGVAREQHAIHVEHFAFEPAGNRPDGHDARHRCRLVGRHAHAQAVIPGDAQQVIDDLEPLGAVGIVDPGDFHELLVIQIVAQRDHHARDGLAADGDAVFVRVEHMREHIVAEQLFERGGKPRTGRDQGSGMGHQRSIVPTRRIFRCNCITP